MVDHIRAITPVFLLIDSRFFLIHFLSHSIQYVKRQANCVAYHVARHDLEHLDGYDKGSLPPIWFFQQLPLNID